MHPRVVWNTALATILLSSYGSGYILPRTLPFTRTQHRAVPSSILPSSSLRRRSTPVNTISTTQLHATETLWEAAISISFLPEVKLNIDGDALTEFFLQTLIGYGIPAFLAIVAIWFASSGRREAMEFQKIYKSSNAVTQLYRELYEEDGNESPGMGPPMPPGFPPFSRKKLKNVSQPKQEYFRVTDMNAVYDSYKFSVTAAVDTRARASSDLRTTNFLRALQRAATAGDEALNPDQVEEIQKAEDEFRKEGSELWKELRSLQEKIAEDAVDLGSDPKTNVTNTAIASNSSEGNATKSTTTNKKTTVSDLTKVNTKITKLELDFMRNIMKILGPERANGVRVALLGNGGGGLLQQVLEEEQPISDLLTSTAKSDTTSTETAGVKGRRVFVTKFPGDVTASQVSDLREEVTAILSSATPGVDEVVLVLQTGGGTVTGYGLAAAQLMRFKENRIRLTICVEQVAASGGYMMCCVADHIVASPFAVLGSIGVIGEVPNAYERLKKEGIEFQTVTAGKYKRTLTPTKKVTKEDIEKQKQDLEEILVLFKSFVAKNRPSLDIDAVATGETWFGEDALDKGLCDEIRTVDDVLAGYVQEEACQVYRVEYKPPPPKGSSVFSELLPSSSSGEGANLRQSVVRGFVSALKEGVSAELGVSSSSFPSNNNNYFRDRYLIKDLDNVADNYRLEDEDYRLRL